LSVEQDAGACVFPSFPGFEPPEWIRRAFERGLAGIVLFGWNCGQGLPGLTAALRAEQPDVLLAIDEEGGDVTRLEADIGSSYPGNHALGVVDDVALTESVAAAIAADLAAVGIDVDLAPVADVNSNPGNPVIGVRSFGSRGELVARHVAAFVRGLQRNGVTACAKHFPGHGDTERDSHLELPTAAGDLEEALLPFRAAIGAGVRAIMTAHIRVPQLDDPPATVSRRILHDLLRVELGFDGVVLTDALEMKGLSATLGVEEGAVRAVAAGADALCLGHDLGEGALLSVERALVDAVREGRLDEARLREAAERVRRLQGVCNSLLQSPKRRPDSELGLAAARRALEVDGDVVLKRAPTVIELLPEANIAAGEFRHSLAELLESTLQQSVAKSEGAGPVDALLDGRQLVLVVRDAHRHDRLRKRAEELLATAPDAVVVETGLPVWRPDAVPYVATHGSGRVNLAAAAEVLKGGG
jgi:beta-N-acetylhexosaminidase